MAPQRANAHETGEAFSFPVAGVIRVAPGDDPRRAEREHDDATWEEVPFPGAWLPDDEAFKDYHAWGRLWFTPPSDTPHEGLGIRLGIINHSDAVYLNGVLLGQTGEVGDSFYFVHPTVSVYEIPPGVLRPGEPNLLAIRIKNFVWDATAVEGPVVIEPYSRALLNVSAEQRLYRMVKGVDLGVAATFVLAAWLFWLLTRRRDALALGVFESAMFLVPLSQALTYAFDDQGIQVHAFHSLYITAVVTMTLALLWYESRLFGYRMNIFIRATIPVSIFAVIASWLGIQQDWAPDYPETTVQWLGTTIMRLVFAFQMFMILWFCGKALIQQKPGAIPLTTGLLALVLMGVQAFLNLKSGWGFERWSWMAPVLLGWAYRFSMLLAALLAYRQSLAAQESLSQRVLTAQDEERHRLSRELHDGVAQSLHAIRIQAKRQAELSGNGDTSAWGDVSEGIAVAVNELRFVSNNLSPIDLESRSLMEALKWYASIVGQRLDIDITVNATARGDADAALKLNLYRIAQEAISNAARHGHAQQVWVTISWSSGQWHLTVEDQGKGIPEQESSVQGDGLRNLRDRAELLGGSLKVMAAKPSGFKVEAIFEGECIADPPEPTTPA